MDYNIEFLSIEWAKNIIIISCFVGCLLFLGKFLNKSQNVIIAKSLSILLIIINLIHASYLIFFNIWIIPVHLPLHLCSINGLICSFILFIPKNSSLYEFNFYTGVIGGAVAIMTPQLLNYDGSSTQYIIYYLSHGLIILIPLYLYYYLNFELQKLSWLKAWMFLNILGAILIPINRYIQSNYMYVNEPPRVNNPLIIGEWPLYLIYLNLIILMLFAIAYFLFKKVLYSRTK
tara:strand:- start:55 stop:750 length:696 start_codon:yes stop_codon:yes gene_type:complete